MKTASVLKKILTCLWAVLIIFTMVILVKCTLQRVRGEQPSLFGYTIYIVQTDSMSGELEVGDAILSKHGADYEMGSVVTYIAKDGVLKGYPITHKIVDIYEENGQTMIQTKGVKMGATLDTPIREDEILGVMVKKLNVSRSISEFIQKPFAPFLILTLPLFLYISYQLISLIVTKKKKEA